MSASTERKNRIAEKEAGTHKKTLAAQEAEQKKAQSRRRWTWGTIGVIVLIAAILLLNSNLMFTSTTALTANGVKYSPAQVNYYYGNEYLTMVNNYGNYLSYLGLDTSLGLAGLDDQESGMGDGGSWRDYFRSAAKNDVQQNSALLDYAAENGITLSEEEIAEVNKNFEGMNETAKSLGYASADKLYAMNYGSGVTMKLVQQAALDQALVAKTYQEQEKSYSWTPEELEEYYQSLNGDRDLFDYATYYVTAETVEETSTNENGEESVSMVANEESRAAAKATAEAILAAYQKEAEPAEEPAEEAEEPERENTAEAVRRMMQEIAAEKAEKTEAAEKAEEPAVETDSDPLTRFNAAVEAQTGGTASERNGSTGSSLPSAYADWMKDTARQAGDAEVFADSEEEPAGYTVVLWLNRNDNHYNTVSVRHILVKAEADEEGNYTDEAKDAARARAEEILAEYEAGEKTEESFAALAEEYSEDEGSNTNGGLYENIYHGQMVPEFNDFCFADHKPGDTGIVYGESGSYAGYHVVYCVGEGQLYSDYIAQEEQTRELLDTWFSELVDGCEVTEGFGFRFVGK